MTTELLTPILGPIRHNHFFEGRILDGRALREEQEAERLHRWQLGRALGAGVVEGLEVAVEGDGADGTRPVLFVAAGLAFNRKGQPLELSADTRVSLVREEAEEEAAGAFGDCERLSGTLVPSNVGIYLLVLSPASVFRESAPKSGLGSGGKVVGCGRRYEVDGVQLRLERLHPADVSGISRETRDLLVNELLPATDLAGLSRLRNVVAHLCFGTEALASLPTDPLATEGRSSSFRAIGALDDLEALEELTGCDVPLALFHWTVDGIAFLDQWSVRRQIGEARTGPLGPAADRFRGVAKARLLQFQRHLDELLSDHPDPAALALRDHFRYLPSLGLVPGPPHGSRDEKSLFAGVPGRRPAPWIDPRVLPSVLDASLAHAAADLDLGELLWIYRLPARHFPLGEVETPPSHLVFTTGHMPYLGNPRYDVARWDFSNFGVI